MARVHRHNRNPFQLRRGDRPARLVLEVLEVRLAPAAYVVTSMADTGAGSLRDALAQKDSTSITFATTGPIQLESELVIDHSVSIQGQSPLTHIQRDASAGNFRLFDITNSAANVTLSNLELSGGSSAGNGGAIYDLASLSLQNCWIHDNSAADGGGVYAYNATNVAITSTTFQDNQANVGGGLSIESLVTAPSATLTNCTFSGNSSSTNGGAIYARADGGPVSIQLLDCTIANNSAATGGGVYAFATNFGSASINYMDTIFANNNGGNLSNSGSGSKLNSLGHNISSDGTGNLSSGGDLPNTSPPLGPIGDYGGLTPTIPLLPGLAIAGGSPIEGVSTDQRGIPRGPYTPSIGAFQGNSDNPAQLSINTSDQFINSGDTFSRAGSFQDSSRGVSLSVRYGDTRLQLPLSYDLQTQTFNLSHVYTTEGTYTVIVDITDTQGGYDERQFEVDVLVPGVPTDTAVKVKTPISPVPITVSDPAVGPGVTVTFLHDSPNLDTLDPTAEIILDIVPVAVASMLNGSPNIGVKPITTAYEVRVINSGPLDTARVVFDYFGNNTDDPTLTYFDRATQSEKTIDSSNSIDYNVDTTAHKITFLLDNVTPGKLHLRDLSGTVFTIAVPLDLPAPTPPGTKTGDIPIPLFALTNAAAETNGIGDGGGFTGNLLSSVTNLLVGRAATVFVSATAFGGTDSDDSFNISSGSSNIGPLSDLPVVSEKLITLPGTILTPGNAEIGLPPQGSVNTDPMTSPPEVPAKPMGSSRLQSDTDPLNSLDWRVRGRNAAAWIAQTLEARDELFANLQGDMLRASPTPMPSRPSEWRDMAMAVAVLASSPAMTKTRRPRRDGLPGQA